MAITISKLSVLLTGSIAGFSAAMLEAKGELSGFQERFERTAERVADVAGIMFAGASLDSGVEYLKSTFEQIDATQKLADTLGIATESLQRMEYAGQLAGASADVVSGGMEKMLKAIGQASEEGGQLAKVFASMGLSISQLQSSKPEEAFGKISDALNRITDPATRAYDASQIFGRGWASMGDLIGQGSAGLNDASSQLDKIGEVSRAQAEKVRQADDAIKQMDASFKAIAQSIVIEASPAVAGMANTVADLADALHSVNPAVIDMIEEAGKWALAFGTVSLVLPKVIEGVEGAAKALKAFAAGEAIAESFAGGFAMVAVEAIAAAGAVMAIDTMMDKFSASADKATGSVNELARGVRDFPPMPPIAPALDKLSEQDRSIQSITNRLREEAMEVGKTKDQIELMRLAYAGASEQQLTNAHAMIAIRDASQDAMDGMKKIADLQDRIKEFGVPEGWRDIDELMGKVPTAQILQMQTMQKTLDGLEKQRELTEAAMNAGKALYEATRTPAEKYADKLKEINSLLEKGTIDNDTAFRGQQKALADLKSSQPHSGDSEDDAPKFLDSGSQAAASFISQTAAKEKAEQHQQQIASNTATANSILTRIESKIGSASQVVFNAIGISI